MASNDLLSAADAAKIVGVGKRQLNHLICQGVLRAEKIGNAYVIRRADLAKVPKVRKPGPKSRGK
jgi:excisionase family DNA binding protein